MRGGQGVQRRHVGQLPEEVDRDDGAGPSGDPFGDTGRIEVEGGGIDIGEDGDRSLVDDGVRRGD